MLILEFSPALHPGDNNIVRYRATTDDQWQYLRMDVETLQLLLANFGLLSTYKIPTQPTSCDNGTTSRDVCVTYGGARIQLQCGAPSPSSSSFRVLTDLVQNY